MTKLLYLVYPYPWFSPRAYQKDVIQFPLSVSNKLKAKFVILNGPLIAGEEREDQKKQFLSLIILYNLVVLGLRLTFIEKKPSKENMYVVLFHLTWSSALLALLVSLTNNKNAKIICKTDLNPAEKMLTSGGRTLIEKISLYILKSLKNVIFIGETSQAYKSLKKFFSKKKVLYCPNGVIMHNKKRIIKHKYDIIIISRFNAEIKGASLYRKVIPRLINHNLKVRLIGRDSNYFCDQIRLLHKPNIVVSDELTHKECLHEIQSSRVFLNLSFAESFCIALLEAFLLGCRIVTTSVGVAPDLANQSPNVFLVPQKENIIVKKVISILNCRAHIPKNRQSFLWKNIVSECGLIELLKK